MKRFSLYLMLLALVACGNKKDEVKPNDLIDVTEQGVVKTLWTRQFESSDKAYGYKLIPAENKGNLFIATQVGEIFSLDAKTGITNWENNLATEISAGPGVGETVLVVGGPEGQVVAMDIDTGTVLWETSVSSEVLSPQVIDRNKVVVRTQDGRIYGFSIQ